MKNKYIVSLTNRSITTTLNIEYEVYDVLEIKEKYGFIKSFFKFNYKFEKFKVAYNPLNEKAYLINDKWVLTFTTNKIITNKCRKLYNKTVVYYYKDDSKYQKEYNNYNEKYKNTY